MNLTITRGARSTIAFEAFCTEFAYLPDVVRQVTALRVGGSVLLRGTYPVLIVKPWPIEFPSYDYDLESGQAPEDFENTLEAIGFRAEVYTSRPSDGSIYVHEKLEIAVHLRGDFEYSIHPLSELSAITADYYEYSRGRIG